jgi:hypothetical protein
VPAFGGAGVDIGEVVVGFSEEFGEGGDAAELGVEGLEFGDEGVAGGLEAGAEVVDDDAVGFLVELEVSVAGEALDAGFELGLDLFACAAEEGGEFEVEAELAALVADEVEDEAGVFAGVAAEAAAELLEEDGGGFGGAQKENGVGFGDVDAFVEEVDSEEDVDFAVAEFAGGVGAFFGGGVGGDGEGGDVGAIEFGGHVIGVGDGDAEGEGTGLGVVGVKVCEVAEDEIGAALVGEVVLLQLGGGVGAAGPGEAGEVGAVVEAVVFEGDEVVAFDGVPEAHFVGDAVIEEAEDGLTVHAFGGCGEAEEDLWVETGDEGLVGFGGGVVGFVEDDEAPVFGAVEGEEVAGVEALDGGEEVVVGGGFAAGGEEFAEGFVAEDVAEAVDGLLEELFAVGEEEEARRGAGLPLAAVVEGGGECFAGACGGDDEVAPGVVIEAFGEELVEGGLLVGVGSEVEEVDGGGGFCVGWGVEGEADFVDEFGVGGIVEVEFVLGPEGVEGAEVFGDDVRGFDFGEFDGPFHAVFEGGLGEVGGADVGGGEAVVAVEEPGFGVEAAAAGIEGDFEFDVGEGGEGFEGAKFGGAGVGGGEDADGDATLGEEIEGGFEAEPAAPEDEADDEGDGISGFEFGGDFVAEGGFVAGVDEEVGCGERSGWAARRDGGRVEGFEDLGVVEDEVFLAEPG